MVADTDRQELLKLKVQFIRQLLDFSRLQLPESIKRYKGLQGATNFDDVIDFIEERQGYWQDDVSVGLLVDMINFFAEKVDKARSEVDFGLADVMKLILEFQEDNESKTKELLFFKEKFKEFNQRGLAIDTIIGGLNGTIVLVKRFESGPESFKDVDRLNAFVNLLIVSVNGVVNNYNDLVDAFNKDESKNIAEKEDDLLLPMQEMSQDVSPPVKNIIGSPISNQKPKNF